MNGRKVQLPENKNLGFLLSMTSHTVRPFPNTGRFRGETPKKDLRPKKDLVTGIFGTKALKLLRCHPNWRFETARSAARRHAPFLGNGGKARRCLMGEIPFSPPSTVHSTGSFLPPSHHRRLSLRTKAPSTCPRHRFALLCFVQHTPPRAVLSSPEIEFGEFLPKKIVKKIDKLSIMS